MHTIAFQTAAGDKSACPQWVLDFWGPGLATDEHKISSLVALEWNSYLLGSLSGRRENKAVTALIAHFDYLRGSGDAREKAAGEALYETMARIINTSLLDGTFSHVERSSFTPMVRLRGKLLPLAYLNSGSVYFVQHMLSLLSKMFAVFSIHELAVDELCSTSGLLLIDEAEAHLHPLWQKRFIKDVLSVFPNLQIIAATHSPFVVASVPDAQVWVCRSDGQTCLVEDCTADYSNRPIGEVLLSDAFAETHPFSAEITELLLRRREAIEKDDEPTIAETEAELLRRNPQYFRYLKLERGL